MMPLFRVLAAASVVVAGTLWTGTVDAGAQRNGAGAAQPPIWSGVYTAAQAEAGKVPFTGLCRRCHSDNLEGSERGPALRGASFMTNWEQQDLDRLRAKIRDTMPPDDPGKLSEGDYLGLVSYILQANGYPAGSTALEARALGGIQLVPKAGEARELRSFSVVQVVGCLAQGADRSWRLTRASEPVLARDRPPSPDELEGPLGQATFELVSVSPFQPDQHAGQKVEVKGLLHRSPATSRVNVSSLRAIGGGC